jgi:hypothetical protein
MNISRQNNYAKELRKPLYKQRVVKSKKVYNRKKYNNEPFPKF